MKRIALFCVSIFLLTNLLYPQSIIGKLGGTTSSQTFDLNDFGENLLFRIQGDASALFTGTFGSGTIPVEGAGTRMMWYPNKAALRAGYVDGTQWDDSNIGIFSTAMGANTTASGPYSTTMGLATTASGAYSTSMGSSSSATGFISTAMGYNTSAESYASVAIGRYNIGGGNDQNWVNEDPLFEIGIGENINNKANAITVLKNGNTGVGSNSPSMKLHIYGPTLVQEDGGGIIIGPDNDDVIIYHHLGDVTSRILDIKQLRAEFWSPLQLRSELEDADGESGNSGQILSSTGSATDWIDAPSGGGNTLDQAYDQGGAGAGRTITADAGAFNVNGADGVLFSGSYGTGTIPATSSGTRMMWYPKKAAFRAGYVDGHQWDDVNIGDYSVAMGRHTTASGENSTAMGYVTTASGNYSTAMGREIIASGDYSVAIALNDQNGTNVTQSNTMAIMGGAVGIGRIDPVYALDVNGQIRCSSILILGGGGSSNWDNAYSWGNHATAGYVSQSGLSANDIPRWNGSNLVSGAIEDDGSQVGIGGTPWDTEKLFVNGSMRLGSAANAGQSDLPVYRSSLGMLTVETSSKRYKYDIQPMQIDAKAILNLNPVKFKYKESNAEGYGYIAEDVAKQLKELVAFNDNGQPESVKYNKLAIFLLEVVKDQQDIIDDLVRRINNLEHN